MDKKPDLPSDKVERAKAAGLTLAHLVASAHATLIQEGISADKADTLARDIVKGGNSIFDGNCGGGQQA